MDRAFNFHIMPTEAAAVSDSCTDSLRLPSCSVHSSATVAQTGVIQGKEANPNLPEQPDEIARSAYECFEEGAAICHIHARDKKGLPSGDPEIFKRTNSIYLTRGCPEQSCTVDRVQLPYSDQ